MDLSGSWCGTLTYGRGYKENFGKSLEYEAEINMDSADKFSGTKKDISGSGVNPEAASIHGEISGERISFIKQYPTRHYTVDNNVIIDRTRKGRKIKYTGVFNDDTNRYEGTWKMSGWGVLFGLIPWRFSGEGTWNLQRLEEGKM